MSELTDQVRVVAEARKRVEGAKDAVKESYERWQDKNNLLLDEAVNTSGFLQVTETLLRELTLQAYAKTGDKHPARGVDIKEMTTYSYNGDDALKWAIDHCLALKLDEIKFKGHIKADPPAFVEVITEPTATISANLEVE